jgi:hypothetical protein
MYPPLVLPPRETFLLSTEAVQITQRSFLKLMLISEACVTWQELVVDAAFLAKLQANAPTTSALIDPP